jgi:hypothetical protein
MDNANSKGSTWKSNTNWISSNMSWKSNVTLSNNIAWSSNVSWKYPYALGFRGNAVEDSQPIVYDENNEESLHV